MIMGTAVDILIVCDVRMRFPIHVSFVLVSLYSSMFWIAIVAVDDPPTPTALCAGCTRQTKFPRLIFGYCSRHVV